MEGLPQDSTRAETYRSGGANLANPWRKRIPGRVVAGAKALGQELLWNAERRAGEASVAREAGRQAGAEGGSGEGGQMSCVGFILRGTGSLWSVYLMLC